MTNLLIDLEEAKEKHIKGRDSMRQLLNFILTRLGICRKSSYEQELQERGVELIPAWFTARMMDDVWGFGLLLENGNIIGIECIDKVVQAVDGSLWLDVRLMDNSWMISDEIPNIIMAPKPDRCDASINASKVVAAFELCTS